MTDSYCDFFEIFDHNLESLFPKRVSTNIPKFKEIAIGLIRSCNFSE